MKPIIGAIYRHVKSQGVYKVLHNAKLEANMSDVVVYRNFEDPAKIFVRPTTEFMDHNGTNARFVKIR